jgi:hypothetical protein
MYLMSISTLLWVENHFSDNLDLHPNGQKHDFCLLDFFGLVEEIENWNVLRADKVMPQFYQSLHCNYERYLGFDAIHRNHGAVACAGTQKQHLSGR